MVLVARKSDFSASIFCRYKQFDLYLYCRVKTVNETNPAIYLFIGEVYVFMDEDIAVRGARRARRAPRGA